MSRASMQGLLAHARLIINGVLFSPNVATKLITFYARLGDVGTARKVFDRINDKNVVAWTAQISAYTQNKCYEDAMQLFSNMLGVGVKPNQFTFGSVLKASCCLRSFWRGLQIQSCVQKSRFMGNLYVQSALVDLHSKCGRMDDARYLFDAMLERDMVSWNAMVGGYAAQGCVDDSFQLFHDMMTEGNSLIDMYAKSGEIEDASRAFGEMKEKNVISWTSLISGYGKHGYGCEAVQLCKEMEDEGLMPNDITFLSVLFACSHSGLAREGLEFFNNLINKHHISPRSEHFSCMVDLFARAGQLEDVHDMICKNNVTPNLSLWGSILGACNIYGNVALGESIATRLINLSPDKSVNYAVLGNIYAATGAWHNYCKIRNLMSQRKLKKTPGCSSIDSPRNLYLMHQ
ncbi:Pentatricopeptide repeat-containing protein At3g20730 [Linum perenne]